jgi:hypothetical protein
VDRRLAIDVGETTTRAAAIRRAVLAHHGWAWARIGTAAAESGPVESLATALSGRDVGV